MARMRIALVISLLALSPALAFADVVGPPPDSCPVGSTPATSHSGPFCTPMAECSSDSACGAGAACDTVLQCVETRACGGLQIPDAEPCTLENVVGPCSGAGTCATGECRTRRVCGGAAGTGCGCRAGGRTRGGLAWAAFALVLVFVRRRS